MTKNNYAFIDSQNVHLSIRSLGWKLDFARFRKYLEDKYQVSTAYLFIGYLPGKESLYTYLQQSGYICIFKPTLIKPDGEVKGNCDAELVLHSMIQYGNYDQAILVTGDGDFYCLAKYLVEKGKLLGILIPNRHRFSAFFKFPEFRPYLRYMNDLCARVGIEKENPRKDRTLRG